jgi:hypothetical protein
VVELLQGLLQELGELQQATRRREAETAHAKEVSFWRFAEGAGWAPEFFGALSVL